MTEEPTQVITTVLLNAEVGDAHWTAMPTVGDQILLQDCALNVGIMGTREQLSTMLDRMREALASSIFISLPNREAHEHVH